MLNIGRKESDLRKDNRPEKAGAQSWATQNHKGLLREGKEFRGGSGWGDYCF